MVWFQVVLVVSGPPIGVCEVCTDVPFHCNSSDIICSLLRLQQPEILLSSQGGILVLATQFAGLQKEHTSVVTTVYRRCH
jgi:hypothetical protein